MLTLWLAATVLTGVVWGIGSVVLGRAAREISSPLMTAIYNAIAFVIFLSLFFAGNERDFLATSVHSHSELIRAIVFGVAGGLGFGIGLTALAEGLSNGRTNIIAPLNSSVVVAMAFIFSLFSKTLPDTWAVVGIVILLFVPWLIAQSKHQAEHVTTTINRDLCFGLLVGFGFGTYMISMAEAPEHLRYFMLSIVQLISCFFMLAVHHKLKKSYKIPKNVIVLAIAFILIEISGVFALRVAFNSGPAAVVTAISIVFEIIFTLGTARIFNKERFSRWQLLGSSIACLGVVLVVLNT